MPVLVLYFLKKEKLEELKEVKNNDFEDVVYRFQLTYDENMDILDINYFPSKRRGSTLPPEIYEKSDNNKTLEFLLPDVVNVGITSDDIIIKSNIYINQTLIFIKKSFF